MTLERDGLFDVSVHKILVEAELQPETIFQCLLAIPGTSFSAKADSMYLKGQGLKAFWSSTTIISEGPSLHYVSKGTGWMGSEK
jgi:hypothetical protein